MSKKSAQKSADKWLTKELESIKSSNAKLPGKPARNAPQTNKKYPSKPAPSGGVKSSVVTAEEQYDEDFEQETLPHFEVETYQEDFEDFQEVSQELEASPDTDREAVYPTKPPADPPIATSVTAATRATFVSKKWEILSKFVQLETAQITLFELYPFEIQATNRQPQACQCPPLEDLADIGVGTDPVERSTCWVQVPGGFSSGSLGFGRDIIKSKAANASVKSEHLARKRLKDFVRQSSALMERILDLEQEPSAPTDLEHSVINFSDSFLCADFNDCHIFEDRAVTCVHGMDGDSCVAIGFGPCTTYTDSLSICGGIALWSRCLSVVEKWLVTESDPVTIISAKNYVFAGCADGGIAGWDLSKGEDLKKIRYSDFLFNGAMNQQDNVSHKSAVSKLHIRQVGSSLELISCDKSGHVSFWKVLQPTNSESHMTTQFLHSIDTCKCQDIFIDFVPLKEDCFVLAKSSSLTPTHRHGARILPGSYSCISPVFDGALMTVSSIAVINVGFVASFFEGIVAIYHQNQSHMVKFLAIPYSLKQVSMCAENFRGLAVAHDGNHIFKVNLATNSYSTHYKWLENGEESEDASSATFQEIRSLKLKSSGVIWLRDGRKDRVEVHKISL